MYYAKDEEYLEPEKWRSKGVGIYKKCSKYGN